MKIGQTLYTVKTQHGYGWSIPEVPECPTFGTQTDAMIYAELRTNGMPHLQAWNFVHDHLKAAIEWSQADRAYTKRPCQETYDRREAAKIRLREVEIKTAK